MHSRHSSRFCPNLSRAAVECAEGTGGFAGHRELHELRPRSSRVLCVLRVSARTPFCSFFPLGAGSRLSATLNFLNFPVPSGAGGACTAPASV